MGRGQDHGVGLTRGKWSVTEDFYFEGKFYKNKPNGQGRFMKNGILSRGKFRQINLRKENPNEAIYQRQVDTDQRQIILQWD